MRDGIAQIERVDMSDLGSNEPKHSKNVKLAWVFGVLALVWFFVSMVVIWNQ